MEVVDPARNVVGMTANLVDSARFREVFGVDCLLLLLFVGVVIARLPPLTVLSLVATDSG